MRVGGHYAIVFAEEQTRKQRGELEKDGKDQIYPNSCMWRAGGGSGA
jgi:hypothetical protein